MALLATWPHETHKWWQRRWALIALLVLATYPLALVGHVAVDFLLGDRQLLRELQYGYTRLVGASVLRGFAWSLIPVAAIWLMLHAAQHWLPSHNAALVLVVLALAGVLALTTPFPPLLAWLLAAAVLLHSLYGLLARRALSALS